MKCHNLDPVQICISRRSDFLVCSLSPIIMEVENGAPGRFEDEFSLQRGQFPLPWDFVFVWKKAIPTCDHLQKLLNILHAPMKLEHLSAFGLNELVGHCLTIPVP